MIHLDSAERSTQRVNDYLHDPAAFSEKLNANRRKRLMSMLDSLSDSVKILEEKLGIEKSDAPDDISSIVQMVIQQIRQNGSERASCGIVDVRDRKDSRKSGQRTTKVCKAVYAKYAQTFIVAAQCEYNDQMLCDFAATMNEHFCFRFSNGNKYGIHQIRECVCKMFVAFAHGYYSKDDRTFGAQYAAWKYRFESGEDHYPMPAYVGCFDASILPESEKEFIQESWRDLIDIAYAPIASISTNDAVIGDLLLPSNPFRVYEESEQEGDAVATL